MMFLKKNKLPENIEIHELVHVLRSLDELLGNLPPELIKGFSASRDFKLFEKVMNELVVPLEPKPVIQEEPKRVEHKTFMQEQLEKANPKNQEENKEETLAGKKVDIDLSKIEELLDKKLKEFEESQQKKEKELIDKLHDSLSEEISDKIDEISQNIITTQKNDEVEEETEPEETQEESSDNSNEEEIKETTDNSDNNKESENKPEETSTEKKSGLLDLDKLRAKINKRVEEEGNKSDLKKEEKSTPDKKETPKKKTIVKKEIKPTPKKKVKKEDLPDMAKIKADIIKKLRGVS